MKTKDETKILRVKRVNYGKEDTPLKDKEYRIGHKGSVGNYLEWKKFALENGFNKVSFEEKDGRKWEQFIFEKSNRKPVFTCSTNKTVNEEQTTKHTEGEQPKSILQTVNGKIEIDNDVADYIKLLTDELSTIKKENNSLKLRVLELLET